MTENSGEFKKQCIWCLAVGIAAVPVILWIIYLIVQAD